MFYISSWVSPAPVAHWCSFLNYIPFLGSFLSWSHLPSCLPMFPGITFQINYLDLNPYLRVFFERTLKTVVLSAGKKAVIGRSLPTGCLLRCKTHRPIIAQNISVDISFLYVASMPSMDPNAGLELTTLRSWPELRSRVRCLTNWTTQEPMWIFLRRVWYWPVGF